MSMLVAAITCNLVLPVQVFMFFNVGITAYILVGIPPFTVNR